MKAFILTPINKPTAPQYRNS